MKPDIVNARRHRRIERLADEIDPGRQLDADELARRVAEARSAYYSLLGLRSGAARRAKAERMRAYQ